MPLRFQSAKNKFPMVVVSHFNHSLFIHFLQRARFKAVESLKHPKKRVIVVCTDVAARGLDIPTVSTVVHYDVARAVDTFVHRSGRTAVSFDFDLHTTASRFMKNRL